MPSPLPTSLDGLSIREIQSALEAFRSLRATRPAKLREARLCLAKFSEQLWTQTAVTLHQNDPERLERVSADQITDKTKIIITIVVIAVIVGLFASQQYLGVGVCTIFGGTLIWRLFNPWPRTTKLESFLAQTKPPLQLIFGLTDAEVITFGTSLALEPRKLANLKNIFGVGFTVNEQWALEQGFSQVVISDCQSIRYPERSATARQGSAQKNP